MWISTIFVVTVGMLLTAEGAEQTTVVCENNYLKLSCSIPIVVQSANFGRQDKTTCPLGYALGSSQLQLTTCNSMSKPLNVVNANIANDFSCNGKLTCSVYASNDIMGGDPCPETAKYLTVVYDCPDSASVTSANVPPAPVAQVPTSKPVAAVVPVKNQQVQSAVPAPNPAKATGTNSSQSVFEKNPWLMWVLIGAGLIGIFAFCCGFRPYLVAKRRNKRKIEDKNQTGKNVENEENEHPDQTAADTPYVGPK